MPKKMTQEEFIERATSVHGDRYDYSESIYELSGKHVIIICKKHGKFSQQAHSHLLGFNCPKCGGLKDTETFIKEAQIIHNNKYTYDNSDYQHSTGNVIITCSIHGDFSQRIRNHLQGAGCPICGQEKNRSNTEEFIDKATLKHNAFYSYDDTVYGTSGKDKIIITCPEHGNFKQAPQHHLEGRGCKKCMVAGFKRQDFIKRCKNNKSFFYIIRLFNNSESFIKIGITGRNIKARCKHIKDYNAENIILIENEPGLIWDLELEIKRKLKDFSYRPEIKFGGYTECYNLSCMTEVETLMYDDNRFKHAERNYNTE